MAVNCRNTPSLTGLLGILMSLALPVTTVAAIDLENDPGIEEVVVTAQKKETNLQETPLSISNFDAGDLARANIDDVLDIQFSVPNLLLSQTNFAEPSFVIRGVGSEGDGSTAVHINGAYVMNPHILETEFFDMGRVEITRGPQGTLYGRNTTSGSLNLITQKPTDELGGYINLQWGNYQSQKIKGAYNIPVSDTVGQRFAFFKLNRSGYTDNLYTGSDIDGRDMYALRSSTAWQAGKNTSLQLVMSQFREDSNRARVAKQLCRKDESGILGCLPGKLDFDITHSGASAQGAVIKDMTRDLTTLIGELGLKTIDIDRYPFPEDNYANSINPRDLRKTYIDKEPEYRVDENFASLTIAHQGEQLTFTSITGYQDRRFETVNDVDLTVASDTYDFSLVPEFPDEVLVFFPEGTDLGRVDDYDSDRTYIYDTTHRISNQISQELQLSSAYGTAFNFTLGLFYLASEESDRHQLHEGIIELAARITGLSEQQRHTSFHVITELETLAVFGESYYDFNDSATLTLGMRYSEDKNETASKEILLTYYDLPEDPYFFGEINSENVSGKIGLDYLVDTHLSDQTLLYGSFTRGYQSGGFNPRGAESVPQEFQPEYINATEIGVKNQFLDKQLQANLTLFYYQYNGRQFGKSEAYSIVFENLDSKMFGAETELALLLNQTWRFELNLAYLDTKVIDASSIDLNDPNQLGTSEGLVSTVSGNFLIDDAGDIMLDDQGIPMIGVPSNLNGNELPYSPKFSIKWATQHQWSLSDSWLLLSRLDFFWQESYYARVYNTRNDRIDAWKVWDFQTTLTSLRHSWALKAYVKNIANESYVTGHFNFGPEMGLPTNVFLLEPRTYGLSVNYIF